MLDHQLSFDEEFTFTTMIVKIDPKPVEIRNATENKQRFQETTKKSQQCQKNSK